VGEITVVAPIANAAISVSDVTVILAPAVLTAFPIRTGIDSLYFSVKQLGYRFFQHCIITNMSSTPIPRSRKGRTLFTFPNGRPKAEQIPHVTSPASAAQLIPAIDRKGC
jgi:hypothetical protein